MQNYLKLILNYVLGSFKRFGRVFVLCGLASGCAGQRSVAPDPRPTPPHAAIPDGVLIMAHGGSEGWNAQVAHAAERLQNALPVALVYGMADRVALSAGVEALGRRGVTKVAVVRLFIWGSAFLHQTEYLLGLREDPPRTFATMNGPDSAAPEPIEHDLTIVTHGDGLAVAPEVRQVLLDRVAEISVDPAQESVLLLAHGMGSEMVNDSLLAAIRHAIAPLYTRGYRDVRAATLREDWATPRADAERAIREYVQRQGGDGGSVLVIPFRLAGIGPYASVLDGLEYRMGRPLLPHPAIGDWIDRMSSELLARAARERSVAEGLDGTP